MNEGLLQGELVRLTMEDPETMAPLYSRWFADSEYVRLQDWDPARRFSVKNFQRRIEKYQESGESFNFFIRTLDGDRIIGDIGIDDINWSHRDCDVGIGLGEREVWGRGYGTDAMRVILRYAFTELNMHRVSLGVFEYNQRGIRSYEKAGFIHEGRQRKYLLKEGRRWDVVYMGMLRDDWLKLEAKIN